MKMVYKTIFKLIGYPFFDAHRKAAARWLISGSEKKRFKYDDLDTKSIVFDVGGYLGDFSYRINEQYGCKCYVFEPVNDFYNKLEERFKNNPDIMVYHFGLSDKDSDVEMSISADGSSSVIDRNSGSNEHVFMKDIESFIKDENIKIINLLKINIEGGEYDLLDKMIECGLISIVVHIQIQFHDIGSSTEKRMKRIINELKKTHELEWQCRPFVWESWKRI